MKASCIPVLLAVIVVCSVGGAAGAAQFQEILTGVFPSAVGGAGGDYDGDGYPDLFVAGGDVGVGVPVAHGPQVYHNNGGLTFADVSSAEGLPSSITNQGGVAWGDYDNNGVLDVLLAGSARPYLYRREPTGYLDVTASAGFPMATNTSASVPWCDYEGNNLLDT